MTGWLAVQALVLAVQLFLIVRTRGHTRGQAEEQVAVHARLADLEQHQIRISPSPWVNATHLRTPVVEPNRTTSYPLYYGRHRPRHLKGVT